MFLGCVRVHCFGDVTYPWRTIGDYPKHGIIYIVAFSMHIFYEGSNGLHTRFGPVSANRWPRVTHLSFC